MSRPSLFVCAFASLVASSVFAQATNDSKPQLAQLELEKTYPVEDVVDPSGLTFHEGRLLTVSDKTSSQICELKIVDQVCKAVPWRKFSPERPDSDYDFEGITSLRKNLFLVSETRQHIYRAAADGALQLEADFSKLDSGLFAKKGAGPEGLVALPGGGFIVTSEREPCGLLTIGKKHTVKLLDADPAYPKSKAKHRPKDATGLWVDEAGLWCLSRNAATITLLDLKSRQLPILASYSFSASIFEYEDNTYGTAEGLAADKKHIYVLLDNNRLATQQDPNDKRPRLLVFKRPQTAKRKGGQSARD